MQKLITITTDFGDSFAASQLRAVAYSLEFKGDFIENHDVSHFSIVEGAFQMLILSRFCPKKSVHIGVIDPGVGSTRAGIIIKTQNYWFVGPDNGLLHPSACQDGIVKVWKLTEDKINKNVTNTFHGRDVFVKAGVYLAQGRKPEDFYSVITSKSGLKTLSFKNGQVLHIDHYGNAKVYMDKNTKLRDKINLNLNNKAIEIPVVNTFSDLNPGSVLALWGSSDTLELAVNLGNAAKVFDLKVGQVLKINS